MADPVPVTDEEGSWAEVLMALYWWYLPRVDNDDRVASILVCAELESFDPNVWH